MRLVLTAADRSHQKSVLQMLGSLASHAPGTPAICHDLGMDQQFLPAIAELAELRGWNDQPYWTGIRNRGRFHAGAYGWKPRMIAAACIRSAPVEIAWLDAGTLVTGSLDQAFALASITGIYSPRSHGTTGDWCHRGLGSRLSLAAKGRLLAAPCRCAGALFLRLDFPGVLGLIMDWLRLSADPDLIAPPGCSTENHRYDQTLLNLLIESRGFNLGATDRCHGFQMHRDIG